MPKRPTVYFGHKGIENIFKRPFILQTTVAAKSIGLYYDMLTGDEEIYFIWFECLRDEDLMVKVDEIQ